MSHPEELRRQAPPAQSTGLTGPTNGALELATAFVSMSKPEITFLVVITAVAGFVLGSAGEIDAVTLIATMVGVALTSAGAGMLNHYVERDSDRLMRRTAGRPLPSGAVNATTARNTSLILIAAGAAILCPLANPLTAGLALLTVALYIYVYTPLKTRTPYNTLVGTIPGAMPALGGYAAATNSVGAAGLALFALLAVWQMPHFLSLAWMYRKDYGRGGFAMLPVVRPDGRSTTLQTLAFTLLLIPVGTIPFFLGSAGPVYAVAVTVAGIVFTVASLRFHLTRSAGDARRVLKTSVFYIPIVLVALVVDSVLH